MDKKTEALKLALEALEKMGRVMKQSPDTEKAIAAIREALADSALERMAENARELGLDYEPPCKTGSQCTSKCEQCRYKYECDKAEQPAQQHEPVCAHGVEKNECDFCQQPAQEPVATVTNESGNPNVSMSWWHEPALPVGTPPYTSPPASKPWVGLTDEEVVALKMVGRDLEFVSMTALRRFARDIEAKLREKNNG